MDASDSRFVTSRRALTVASATLSYVGLFGYNC
jgi:hypothetical protein